MDRSVPRGVLFDLDGTLYRMKWYMRPVLTFKVFPHPLRLPRFLKERNRYAGMDMGSRGNLIKALSESLGKIEKRPAREIASWIDNVFYPAFIESMSYFKNTRPGLPELLQSLRNASIRLAVVSDYGAVPERLEKLSIASSLFDHIGSSELSGALKPAPGPFLKVADAWTMRPEDILVIGDRDDTDGAAARAAGMRFMRVSERSGMSSGSYRWEDIQSLLLSFCKEMKS